jgi:hypothetical protein
MLRDHLKFLAGYVLFLLTGKTPQWAYLSLIRLFCYSGGDFNRRASKIVNVARPYYKIQGESAIVPRGEIEAALQALRADGFYVFKNKLPESICNSLEKLARSSEVQIHPPSPRAKGFYADKSENTETMRLSESDLISDPAVRSVAGDPGLIDLAQRYLGPGPRLDHIGMWWSVARQGDPSKEGAQEYHFDLDRLRFVQFFVYLTDCGSEDGPHCFVRGSHTPEGTSRELLRKGYARIPDKDVKARFPAEDLIEITGSRGTVFAVDTLAFHKGKQPTRHDRLVLQTVMCSSLFGANKPRHKITTSQQDALSLASESYPGYLARFKVC